MTGIDRMTGDVPERVFREGHDLFELTDQFRPPHAGEWFIHPVPQFIIGYQSEEPASTVPPCRILRHAGVIPEVRPFLARADHGHG